MSISYSAYVSGQSVPTLCDVLEYYGGGAAEVYIDSSSTRFLQCVVAKCNLYESERTRKDNVMLAAPPFSADSSREKESLGCPDLVFYETVE